MNTWSEIVCCFVVAFVTLPALAQEANAPKEQKPSAIAGDWQGTLSVGMQQLHLILHITQGADGALKASLDSVDQGANGIGIDKITFQDGKLFFSSKDVHGTYEGKLGADGTQMEGTWSQGQPLPLSFKRAVKASDIDGGWVGTLDAGGKKLRLLFVITNTPDGLHATLTSLDQGGGAISVTSIKRADASLTLELADIHGAFSGSVNQEITAIDGTWTQNGAGVPLTLKKVTNPEKELAPPVRPQDPVKPYPYREEDVVYENKTQNVELAATLTIPQGKGPFPAVVLITGSGPQDRNEALLGHRPFLVLADYLTRKGIIVLRADDRGVGKSTGDFNLATTADFATDTEAGIAFLKARPEVDPHKIGLIGHSEGGVIAPMIAARNKDVAFIVMMAGTGVPGDAIIAEQTQLIAEANGTPHEAAEKEGRTQAEILALVKSENDPVALDKKLREKLTGQLSEPQIGAAIQRMNTPWMHYFIAYDPAPALAKVSCPVLALNGEKDLQVPPKQNLPVIRKALESGGNKHFEIVEFPGLNHLFQTATTGSPAEYVQISETIAPVVLEKIASWIVKQ